MRLSVAALWIATCLLMSMTVLPAWAGTDGKLALATDLKADSGEARKLGVPLLIFYSLKGCPYCEVIRSRHLLPMQGETSRRVIIRQINLQDASPMRDFAGRMTTHREYSQAQKVSFAPLVTLVDGEGRALAEPLKGAMLPDFYGAHLDDAINEATAKLRQNGRK